MDDFAQGTAMFMPGSSTEIVQPTPSAKFTSNLITRTTSLSIKKSQVSSALLHSSSTVGLNSNLQKASLGKDSEAQPNTETEMLKAAL